MIIGISAYFHDSAVCITRNGEILYAAQEERFSRTKHDSSFPILALKDAIRFCNIHNNNIEAVVFYEKPFLKFERILESYYAYCPKGIGSFLNAIPQWLSRKLYIKQKIIKNIKALLGKEAHFEILFSPHHLSHAASAFYPSAFKESAVLCIDGVGEWATTSLFHANAKEIKALKEIHYPHSLGLIYSAFTYFLGFKVNSGEYKLMGLAPFGNKNSNHYLFYQQQIRNELIHLYEDGSFELNMKNFSFHTGLYMIPTKKWERLFKLAKRNSYDEIKQEHGDLALAIQNILEDIILKLAKHLKTLSQSKNLCLAGGVALNCVANTRIRESGLFENIFVQPASGDAGGALGAALAAEYIYFNKERTLQFPDGMKNAYLGPSYTSIQVESVLEKFHAIGKEFQINEDFYHYVASALKEGKVIGWFQGRMEFGPRALGNRSILADSSIAEMQKKLNQKIKFRESFRPFAPVILEEDLKDVFLYGHPSPYMNFIDYINLKPQKTMDSDDWTMKQTYISSKYPAITHVDESARLQSLNHKSNPLLYHVLKSYKEQNKHGILVNTSFNVRGEPIVASPEDAYKCFMNSGIDILVLQNYVLLKEEQQPLDKKHINHWKKD